MDALIATASVVTIIVGAMQMGQFVNRWIAIRPLAIPMPMDTRLKLRLIAALLLFALGASGLVIPPRALANIITAIMPG